MDGQCEVKKCRQPRDYVYLGVDLCQRHWEQHCDDDDSAGLDNAKRKLERITGRKLREDFFNEEDERDGTRNVVLGAVAEGCDRDSPDGEPATVPDGDCRRPRDGEDGQVATLLDDLP